MRAESSSAFLESTTPPETSAAAPAGLSCTPEVTGLIPADISSITIQCPGDYVPREGRSAVPIAGRFTSDAELVEAFCVAKPTLRAISAGTTIDFDHNAVVAYAYDENAGPPPTLYRRGDDLWLKVTQTECHTTPPQLASVVFVVPKTSAINEQTCSRCP